MFSHIETFSLFTLTIIQGLFLRDYICAELNMGESWGLIVGLVVGFITASIELQMFFALFRNAK